MLAELGQGDDSAAQRLLPLVYAELRALAGSHFRHQRADHTLQPTALVHEAFVRLIDQTNAQWNDRTHFFAVAATAMRQILTDHARRHNAEKRGGEWRKVCLDDAAAGAAAPQRSNASVEIDIIALDEALNQLQALDRRKHHIVELRFFGGLSIEDVANLIGVSTTTVENEWRSARAWLNSQLSR